MGERWRGALIRRSSKIRHQKRQRKRLKLYFGVIENRNANFKTVTLVKFYIKAAEVCPPLYKNNSENLFLYD